MKTNCICSSYFLLRSNYELNDELNDIRDNNLSLSLSVSITLSISRRENWLEDSSFIVSLNSSHSTYTRL